MGPSIEFTLVFKLKIGESYCFFTVYTLVLFEIVLLFWHIATSVEVIKQNVFQGDTINIVVL